jgi:hypothetical protein
VYWGLYNIIGTDIDQEQQTVNPFACKHTGGLLPRQSIKMNSSMRFRINAEVNSNHPSVKIWVIIVKVGVWLKPILPFNKFI